MKDLGSSGADDPRVFESVEMQNKLAQQMQLRNNDLMNRIALRECGAISISEEELAADYGMTPDQVERFKRDRKHDIERHKEEHLHGKFMVAKSIGKTLALKEVMVQARLEGNDDLANRVRSILVESELIVPIKTLKDVAEIYKLIGEESEKVQSQVNIQINGDTMKRAEEILDRANRRVVEIQPEKKDEKT